MNAEPAFRPAPARVHTSAFTPTRSCPRRARRAGATRGLGGRSRRGGADMLFERLFRREEEEVLDLEALSLEHPAVSVRDVRKTFLRKTKRGRQRVSTTVTALDGISFSVGRGEIFGLLGPNSSGKTTTLRCLTTLCKPDSGTIRFYGEDILADTRLARSMLGFVAQSAGVDKVLTGREHLELFAGLAHLTRAEREDAIEELVDVLGLGPFIDRQAGVYSGGVVRRLDLAICLLHRPPILVLDEPTVGLDLDSREVIWRVLQRLRDDGAAIVLTSHYLEEVDLLADRVAVMEQGVVLAEGTPSALKDALGGDRVSVRLDEFTDFADAQRVAAEVKRRGLAHAAQVNRVRANTIELVVDPERAQVAAQIIAVAKEMGFPRPFSFSQSKPSLDDVYLAATGRSLMDADMAAKEKRDKKSMQKEFMV